MARLLAAVPNIGSQIERAVIAYLKWVFDTEAAQYNWYFSNDWQDRVAPLFDVLAHKSTETIPHTRNESYAVRIEAKWKGASIIGQTTEADPNTDWQKINDMIGLVMAAMSVSAGSPPDDLPSTIAQDITTQAIAASSGDNADLAGFTVEYVEFKGSQRAEVSEGGTFYIKEVRNFEIRAGNY